MHKFKVGDKVNLEKLSSTYKYISYEVIGLTYNNNTYNNNRDPCYILKHKDKVVGEYHESWLTLYEKKKIQPYGIVKFMEETTRGVKEIG